MKTRGRVWDAGRKTRHLYRTVTLFHAAPSGGPLPRGEASWRNVNGVMLNIRLGWGWFVFRRWYA